MQKAVSVEVMQIDAYEVIFKFPFPNMVVEIRRLIPRAVFDAGRRSWVDWLLSHGNPHEDEVFFEFLTS